MKNYENSGKGYPLVKHLKELHNLHSDLPLLPKRIKIGKREKLMYNLYSKKYYVIHIKILKQALDHRLILVKVCR